MICWFTYNRNFVINHQISHSTKSSASLATSSSSSSWLPSLCAVAYGAWLLVVSFTASMDDAQQSGSLLTPARFFKALYCLTSVLLLASVCVDCFYRHLSLFDKAARPNALRVLFIISCVLSGCWSLLTYYSWELLAALTVTLVWLLVLSLYLFALYERGVRPFAWRSFFGSELGFRLLFASVSMTTVLSWTGVVVGDSSSSLSSSLVPLGVLCVLALSGLVYGEDPVIVLVVSWFLLALASNTTASSAAVDGQVLSQVQASATLAAGVLISMLLVSIVQRVLLLHTYVMCGAQDLSTGTNSCEYMHC